MSPSRKPRLGVAMLSIATAGIGACSALSGLGDLSFDGPGGTGGGGAGGFEASATSTTGHPDASSSTRGAASGGSTASSTGGGASSSTGGGGASCGCVKDPPFGWTGPIAIRTDGADCDGEYPDLAFKGGASVTGNPACTACACGIEPCFAATLHLFGAPACMNETQTADQPVTQCASFTSAVTYGVEIEPIFAEPVTPCSASGGALVDPTHGFQSPITACTLAAEAPCAGGTCFSTPLAPYEPKVCVFAPGTPACPPGYDSLGAFFAELTDDWQCTACACGAPLPNCPGSVGLYTDAACLVAPRSFANDGNCADTQGVIFNSVSVSTGTPRTPSGGQPMGAVAGNGQTTVCCR